MGAQGEVGSQRQQLNLEIAALQKSIRSLKNEDDEVFEEKLKGVSQAIDELTKKLSPDQRFTEIVNEEFYQVKQWTKKNQELEKMLKEAEDRREKCSDSRFLSRFFDELAFEQLIKSYQEFCEFLEECKDTDYFKSIQNKIEAIENKYRESFRFMKQALEQQYELEQQYNLETKLPPSILNKLNEITARLGIGYKNFHKQIKKHHPFFVSFIKSVEELHLKIRKDQSIGIARGVLYDKDRPIYVGVFEEFSDGAKEYQRGLKYIYESGEEGQEDIKAAIVDSDLFYCAGIHSFCLSEVKNKIIELIIKRLNEKKFSDKWNLISEWKTEKVRNFLTKQAKAINSFINDYDKLMVYDIVNKTYYNKFAVYNSVDKNIFSDEQVLSFIQKIQPAQLFLGEDFYARKDASFEKTSGSWISSFFRKLFTSFFGSYSSYAQLKSIIADIKAKREHKLFTLKTEIIKNFNSAPEQCKENVRAFEFFDQTAKSIIKAQNFYKIEGEVAIKNLKEISAQIENIYAKVDANNILSSLHEFGSFLRAQRLRMWLEYNKTLGGFFGFQSELVKYYDCVLNKLSSRIAYFNKTFFPNLENQSSENACEYIENNGKKIIQDIGERDLVKNPVQENQIETKDLSNPRVTSVDKVSVLGNKYLIHAPLFKENLEDSILSIDPESSFTLAPA